MNPYGWFVRQRQRMMIGVTVRTGTCTIPLGRGDDTVDEPFPLP